MALAQGRGAMSKGQCINGIRSSRVQCSGEVSRGCAGGGRVVVDDNQTACTSAVFLVE